MIHTCSPIQKDTKPDRIFINEEEENIAWTTSIIVKKEIPIFQEKNNGIIGASIISNNPSIYNKITSGTNITYNNQIIKFNII